MSHLLLEPVDALTALAPFAKLPTPLPPPFPSQRTVKLHNHSDTKVYFVWKRQPSTAEDVRERMMRSTQLPDQADLEALLQALPPI